MWKVVAEILNCWLTASITFYNLLRIFCAGCGTGTITLEAKLLQQLAPLREEVLYMILLDLKKEYDALHRFRCLKNLEGYGDGLRACQILQKYWNCLKMVAREGRYYGAEFPGDQGVTQDVC